VPNRNKSRNTPPVSGEKLGWRAWRDGVCVFLCNVMLTTAMSEDKLHMEPCWHLQELLWRTWNI